MTTASRHARITDGSGGIRRRWLLRLGLAALLALAIPLSAGAEGPPEGGGLAQRRVWNFDVDQIGEPPGAFATMSSVGAAGSWTVQADPRSPSPPNHVTATSNCTVEVCFQLLLVEDVQYDYADAAVRLRAAGDGASAAGGLAFNAHGPTSFYAAVVDFAEQLLEVVRVRDGAVVVLGQARLLPRDVAWHTLRVQHNTILSKDFLEVTFDGKIVFSHWDQPLGGGQVGLVTRGRGRTAFDSFHVVQLYSQRPLSPPAAY